MLDQEQKDKLGQYLKQEGLIHSTNYEIKPLSGGQSNPTYLIQDKDAQFVMRRKPFGQLLASAHAIDREYRVMHALSLIHI